MWLQLPTVSNIQYLVELLEFSFSKSNPLIPQISLENVGHFLNRSIYLSAGAWNITTSGENATVCGRIELAALININYTSILQEVFILLPVPD